jgi:hypothetical protein
MREGTEAMSFILIDAEIAVDAACLVAAAACDNPAAQG